jgi:uncharacterized membrane protein YoaK (UPF0700 family)
MTWRSSIGLAQLAAAENSLRVAALLAAAGGFLDAFTYVGHGHVFANAMTGNVVLLAVSAVSGDGRQALAHLLPIVSFVAGVAAADVLRLPRVSAWTRDPAVAALVFEIALLFALSWIPREGSSEGIVLAVAFASAMLVTAFPGVDAFTYNATFTTGNIRQFAESAFLIAFTPLPRDSALRRKPRVFAVLIGSFLVGAATGAATVARWHNGALVVPMTLLSVAGISLWLAYKRRDA